MTWPLTLQDVCEWKGCKAYVESEICPFCRAPSSGRVLKMQLFSNELKVYWLWKFDPDPFTAFWVILNTIQHNPNSR